MWHCKANKKLLEYVWTNDGKPSKQFPAGEKNEEINIQQINPLHLNRQINFSLAKDKRRSKHFKNIGNVADMYSFRNNAIFRKWTCLYLNERPQMAKLSLEKIFFYTRASDV